MGQEDRWTAPASGVWKFRPGQEPELANDDLQLPEPNHDPTCPYQLHQGGLSSCECGELERQWKLRQEGKR